MNMKRKYNFWLLIICALFCGCQKKEYPFLGAKSDIISISIVEATYSYSYEELNITTLVVIEEKEQFIEEFSNITVSTVFGYAYALHENLPENENVQAIKFEYRNGDFELIAVPGPGIAKYSVNGYWAGENYNAFAGTVTLDSKSLEILVQKYLKQ